MPYRVRSEYDQLSKSQKSIAAYLEQQSAQICIPDPDPSGILISNSIN